MKKKSIQLLAVILQLLIPLLVFPQEWIRIYGDDISCYVHSLTESKDYGYIYGGVINQGQEPKYGWIFKTDINGEILWDKKFGDFGDKTAVHDIRQTLDGGYILLGDTKKLDPYYDPFVMKLNTCGEKEWCKILHLPNKLDFGTRIVQLPNGNFVALLNFFSYEYSERIWLMCFDEDGDFLWKMVYAQDDPFINNEDGFDLLLTSDSNILITGKSGYPLFPDTNTFTFRNFLIKVDFNGNEKWALVWGKDQQFYGYSSSSIDRKNGDIFTVGRHLSLAPNSGYSATLLKTKKHGEELTYYDLIDNTQFGNATTIDWFKDSTLAIGIFWDSLEIRNIGVVKCDTIGNINKKNVLFNTSSSFRDAVTTFDNKLLLTTGLYIGNNWDIYAFKVNSDLEFDSIYTQAFVYDSLCPYAIVSDTIPLDCVIVGLEEEKQHSQAQLTIIPNPATDKIRIVLPEYIFIQSQTSGMNSSSWKYNYSSESRLQIYDVWGSLVSELNLAEGQKEATIELHKLSAGIYVVRVVLDGQVVSGKFVKR